ncbi:MAG: hypothetical protein QM664_14460, partial [Flavihumibacter sp.]
MKQPEDFFAVYKESAWQKDAERMIALYADEVEVFDMWQQGYQHGIAGWSALVRDWLNGLGDERVAVGFERIHIRAGSDTAFASALVSFKALAAGGQL